MTSTRERCLAEMRAAFQEFDAAVEAIPRERLTEVGVTDEWSPRDLLAHVAGYERWVAGRHLRRSHRQDSHDAGLLRPG